MLKQAQIITIYSLVVGRFQNHHLGVIKSYCKAQLENEAVSAASLQIHILEACLIDSFFLFLFLFLFCCGNFYTIE